MARLCWRGGLAAFLFILAGSAFAAPRLERERCTFKPPRGDRVECFVLIVPENREQPEGREVRLKVAVLKAKRTAGAEPMVYLSGGPGDAPLVASSPGADALAEGDWWNETANIRRKRDVIILSQRGAGGATLNLDCFDPRTSEPAKARRRAVTEEQEREILTRCRSASSGARSISACTPRRRWPTTWPTWRPPCRLPASTSTACRTARAGRWK